MRVELTRTFRSEPKKVFDYLTDVRTWPTWYSGVMEIIDADEASWSTPGDKVRFAYKLLGRRVEGESTLDVVREAEYIRFSARLPLVGTVVQEWTYGEVFDGEFPMRVVFESEEPNSFFGSAIDKMVIPRVLERDLIHTLDQLEEIFAIGIP